MRAGGSTPARHVAPLCVPLVGVPRVAFDVHVGNLVRDVLDEVLSAKPCGTSQAQLSALSPTPVSVPSASAQLPLPQHAPALQEHRTAPGLRDCGSLRSKFLAGGTHWLHVVVAAALPCWLCGVVQICLAHCTYSRDFVLYLMSSCSLSSSYSGMFCVFLHH